VNLGGVGSTCDSGPLLPSLPSLIVEEDRYGSYARLLMKYFLSEGVMCGHTLLLASANEKTEDILKVGFG